MLEWCAPFETLNPNAVFPAHIGTCKPLWAKDTLNLAIDLAIDMDRNRITTHAYKVNIPRVTSQTIDGEVIIIDLQTGHYYSLTQVGAEIWNELEAGRFSDEIALRLGQRYDGKPTDLLRVTEQFVAELLREELITPNEYKETNFSPPAFPAQPRRRFESPTLQKYSDMQDLLLLDPIHETDETGWPMLKPVRN